MQRFFIYPIFLVLVSALAGCEGIRALTFKADERYVTGQKVSAFAVFSMKESEVDELLKKIEEDYPNLENYPNFLSHCSPTSEVSTQAIGAIVPIVTALGALTDAATSALQNKVEKLIAASKSEYEVKIITFATPATISNSKLPQCIVAIRYYNKKGKDDKNGTPEVGMISVFQFLSKSPSSFTITLRYYKAINSPVITGRGKPVKVMVKFTGKAAYKSRNGVPPKIISFFEETLDLGAMAIDQEALSNDEAISTGLLPLPSSGADAIEITVSFTETGSALPNEDKAKADIKALSNAVKTIVPN